MNQEWQLQTAKNRLSHVVEQAREQGPQTITLRGKPAVVVLSIEDFRNLSSARGKLPAFLAKSPLHGAALDLERSRDAGRDVSV